MNSRERNLPNLRIVNIRSWSLHHGCDDEMDQAIELLQEADVDVGRARRTYDYGYDSYDEYVQDLIFEDQMLEAAEEEENLDE